MCGIGLHVHCHTFHYQALSFSNLVVSGSNITLDGLLWVGNACHFNEKHDKLTDRMGSYE